MDSNDKLIIEVSGTIDLDGSMTALRSDKTLIGLGATATIINGGLELYKRKNIIIRNITFVNAPDDLLKVNQNTTNLWVDHCTFTDGDTPDPEGENHDGLFDITRQSNYITISYCVFLNHSKSILIGHSDGYADDVGYLKTTLHHNWFDGTRQRHPRVRFGQVHCFNNFYLDNELYGVASACEADVVVEGNYFQNVPHPTYVGYAESPAGDLVERENKFVNSGTPETRGAAFDPKSAYAYTLDPAENVPSIVRALAGAGSPSTGVQILPPRFSVGCGVFRALYNPLSARIDISFVVDQSGPVNLTMATALGQAVNILHEKQAQAGRPYKAAISVLKLGAGVYYAVLHAGGINQTIRILLVK